MATLCEVARNGKHKAGSDFSISQVGSNAQRRPVDKHWLKTKMMAASSKTIAEIPAGYLDEGIGCR